MKEFVGLGLVITTGQARPPSSAGAPALTARPPDVTAIDCSGWLARPPPSSAGRGAADRSVAGAGERWSAMRGGALHLGALSAGARPPDGTGTEGSGRKGGTDDEGTREKEMEGGLGGPHRLAVARPYRPEARAVADPARLRGPRAPGNRGLGASHKSEADANRRELAA